MCVLQKRSRYQSRRNQIMKVIVLMIVMTMYGCGIKPSVSCNVNDINTVIEDCKKQPQFGISKEF
jgi:predicted small lipoprotein YifL